MNLGPDTSKNIQTLTPKNRISDTRKYFFGPPGVRESPVGNRTALGSIRIKICLSHALPSVPQATLEHKKFLSAAVAEVLEYQGWGTCGPREHLMLPASELPLTKIEHSNASKRNSV